MKRNQKKSKERHQEPKRPEVFPNPEKPERPDRGIIEIFPGRTQPEISRESTPPEVYPEKSPQVNPQEIPQELPTEKSSA